MLLQSIHFDSTHTQTYIYNPVTSDWAWCSAETFFIFPFLSNQASTSHHTTMEACTLELHPTRKVHIALFRNVTNASELRQRLISQDNTLACSLINAKLVRYGYAQKHV